MLASGLKAFQVKPSDRIAYSADVLNPTPDDRRDGFSFTLTQVLPWGSSRTLYLLWLHGTSLLY